MQGQPQPAAPVSSAAVGSAPAESRPPGTSSQPAPDLSGLDRSKQLVIGSAVEVARPHKQRQTMHMSDGLVSGKAENDGMSMSHPAAVNGFAHEAENRPQTLTHRATG